MAKLNEKSMSNGAHFVVFLSRRCQNVENVNETFINTKFPFNNVLSMTIELRMYLKFLQKLLCLGSLVQNKPSVRGEENNVEFLERHYEKLSFVHKKEAEHSLQLSLSVFVFYQCIFNLEMQKLVLKITTSGKRAGHKVDGCHFLSCQICFFPTPLRGRPLDLWAGYGTGSRGDVFVVRTSKPVKNL